MLRAGPKMYSITAVLLALTGGTVLGNFLEDGKEYVYDAEGYQNTGTMDYHPAAAALAWKARVTMQVSGDKINFRVADRTSSQYVGEWDLKDWPWDRTNFLDGGLDYEFSAEYKNGQVVSIYVPKTYVSKGYIDKINIIRALATTWQIKLDEKLSYFETEEKLLHGDCKVHYIVTDGIIRKSVSHFRDCANRKFRLVDNYRGYRCDGQWGMQAWKMGGNQWMPGRESPEPIYSKTDTLFVVDKIGDKFLVKKMVSAGAVVAQYFKSEGASRFVHVNRSMTLVSVGASDSSINPTSVEKLDDLSYTFADADYKWNKDRNLHDKEPFFSSGDYFLESQATLQGAISTVLDMIQSNFDVHGTDPKTIENLHKYGAGSAMPIMFALNYDSFISIFSQLKTEGNPTKLGLFKEYAMETGTSAAAMFIKDSILAAEFGDETEAARGLSGIAFNIRRPNEQLINEIATLLKDGSVDFTGTSAELSLAHLIQRTCVLAGGLETSERQQCDKEVTDKWAQKYFTRFENAKTNEEKHLMMSVMQNLQSKKVADLLAPVVSGDYPGVDDSIRSDAIWSSVFGNLVQKKITQSMLPVFMNMRNSHGLRISALEALFISNPEITTLSAIMTQMVIEKDIEVINYVYSLFIKYANSVNSCVDPKKVQKVQYFIKYMNQMGIHTPSFGLGVSHTFRQQFRDEQYGFGGHVDFYLRGSHQSSAPSGFGLNIATEQFSGYKSDIMAVFFTVEGLGDALVNMFKKMPERTWKLDDLATIFQAMNLDLKPNQPLKLGVTMMIKNVVVSRIFFEKKADDDDAKLKELWKSFTKSSGNQVSVNLQKAMVWGTSLYEQPSDSGLPMAHVSGMTTISSVQGTIKRGLKKGLLFRSFDYDIHINTQGTDLITFFLPEKHVSYGIVQDRIYTAHFPRTIMLGFSFTKKKLTLEISRPEENNPLLFVMHSRTSVMARSGDIRGEVDLTDNCPQCFSKFIISGGPDAPKTTVVLDNKSDYYGSHVYSDYFDCELDLKRGSAFDTSVMAFLPYNKGNDASGWGYFQMGIWQILSFYRDFPRVEQCGVSFKSSQSDVNPVKKMSISGEFASSRDKKSKKPRQLGQNNWKYQVKLEVNFEGTSRSENRNFKLFVVYKPGSMGIENDLTWKAQWADNKQFGFDAYIICFMMKNKYPELGNGFMQLDMDSVKSVKGDLSMYYGESKSCNSAGGVVKVDFEHSTTELAVEELLEKWYYKECMEEKDSAEWKTRNGLPFTTACWLTMWDANMARKYTWNMLFENATPRVKNWLSKAQTLIKVGLLPSGGDLTIVDGALTDTPEMNFEFLYKNNDEAVDATFATPKGTSKFPDFALSVPFTGRQLKVDSGFAGLFAANLIAACVQTSGSVLTMDNSTYSYSPTSCWTLVSGHCAPNPSYAVFTKKNRQMPLALRAYIGGHKIEFQPASSTNIKITFNDAPVTAIPDKSEQKFKQGTTEIFSIVRYGPVYTLTSVVTGQIGLKFPNVAIIYDGTFVEVIPGPNVKGQHCGVCGDFDGNAKNDLVNKAGKPVDPNKMARAWCK